jgi:D-sedoheptulose 7-phosphate isomerase
MTGAAPATPLVTIGLPIRRLPMDPTARIRRHFTDSANLKLACVDELAPQIIKAADVMTQCLLGDRKILACGNGGSAADAQHFSAEMLGRFERERMGLPAISLTTDTSTLTAIGNDYDYSEVFSKQVAALGREGDVLLAISTSGNSGNVLAAVRIAQERGMKIVALTGKGGGRLGELCGNDDVHICVPHGTTTRIQETHILAIHCLCDAIDCALLGDEE